MIPTNAKIGPAYAHAQDTRLQIVDRKYVAFDTMEDELEVSEDSLLENVAGFQPMQLMHMRRNLVS